AREEHPRHLRLHEPLHDDGHGQAVLGHALATAVRDRALGVEGGPAALDGVEESRFAAYAENRLLLPGEAGDRAVFRGCGRAHRHTTGAEPAVGFAHPGRQRGVVTQTLAAQPSIGGALAALSRRHWQPLAG